MKHGVYVARKQERLNPCCNGMTIELTVDTVRQQATVSLNPCCNGMTIELRTKWHERVPTGCLNPCCNGMTIEFS